MHLVLALASCDVVANPLAQLHLLARDDQTEVQHDFYGHVMPLEQVLASHDANGIVNGTIVILRSI